MQYFDGLVQKIITETITKSEFIKELQDKKSLEDIDVEDFENLRLLGLPICEINDHIFIETASTNIKDQKFCIVDIEANGSKPGENQIIEIGAIIIQNGIEIDRFESFVKADILPKSITILTGITLDDLKDAPSLGFVLEQFRLFLADAVFIAHNVNFDYNFISASLQKVGFGPLLNRKLCTIELSKQCFKVEKYGLGFLMEHFKMSFGSHHRALVDARMADFVFNYCLKNLSPQIKTTEELIELSRPKKQKKQKKQKKKNKN